MKWISDVDEEKDGVFHPRPFSIYPLSVFYYIFYFSDWSEKLRMGFKQYYDYTVFRISRREGFWLGTPKRPQETEQRRALFKAQKLRNRRRRDL